MSTPCHRTSRLVRKRVAGTALVLALAVSACGADDPITEPVADATTTSAVPDTEATTTTSAAALEPAEVPPTSTAAMAGASPGSEGSNGTRAPSDFTGEPSWSEILDRLDGSEQSCIREVLDEAGLDEAGRESAMSRRLFSDDFPMAEDAAMFACLAADTANDIFVASMVAAIESELGPEVSDSEAACLRDWTARIDLASLVESTGESPDEAAAALAFLGGLANCLPDGLISLFLSDTGVSFDELDENERTCLRELVADLDWDGSEDDAEAALAGVFELSFGLLECLPEQMDFDAAPAVEVPAGVDDDHANAPEGATAAGVGEPVEGSLEYDGDADYFVFDAVEGEFYEIGVEPVTLEDPTVALYGGDGAWLDYNDDSGDSLAPLLYWSAGSSGRLYVEVGGYGTGSYILTVAVSDVDDDHANSSAGATAAAVGEPVEGALDYDGDIDFFVFDAVEGELYDMRVFPGTLEDPTVALYDVDGLWLDSDDDSGGSLAPRLYWEASSTGPLYVEVAGYGAGSYTLTITHR